MLPHSSFDACSSARKTFVYARMFEYEDNRFDAKKVCAIHSLSEDILLRVFIHPQIGTTIHATTLNNT